MRNLSDDSQDTTYETCPERSRGIRHTHLYGPVPSRRLGLSLGVDIVPFKVCTLDCVYCQLGRTTEKTIERKDYCGVEPVLAELKERLAEGLQADYITISGSGEPTLNSRLGELIENIKNVTDIRVAVLTNGTLLYRRDVRADCARADVVMPSLDAGGQQTFEKINRPHKDISIEKLITGLCAFRDEYAGPIWLEVFLVEGINTDAEQIATIREAIERIRPDKVQLNTAVRPAAQVGINRVDAEKLRAIAEQLGHRAEAVADFSLDRHGRAFQGKAEDATAPGSAVADKMASLLSMLKRRPCSLNDICSALGIARNEALKYIAHFQQQKVVDSSEKDGVIFFSATAGE